MKRVKKTKDAESHTLGQSEFLIMPPHPSQINGRRDMKDKYSKL